MPLAVPVAETQVWLFSALSLVFFAFVVRAMIQRQTETSARHEASSRLCIIVQSVGIGMAGIGPMRPILPSSSLPAIAGCAAVLLLMGGSIALFASSSTALGKNWSFEARTRTDHELIKSGPYAHVRHPIYLGMLLFLLGLAVALGHWIQLVLAVPIFPDRNEDAHERRGPAAGSQLRP